MPGFSNKDNGNSYKAALISLYGLTNLSKKSTSLKTSRYLEK
jgi:hypothetical protein